MNHNPPLLSAIIITGSCRERGQRVIEALKCRLMAVHRARSQSWGRLRRLFYGFATPVAVPFLKMMRIVRNLRDRPALWSGFIAALPVVIITYLWSAIGESLGYLFGLGNAEYQFYRYVVGIPRDMKRSV